MNWDGLVKGSFLALGSFKDDKDEVSESRVEQLFPEPSSPEALQVLNLGRRRPRKWSLATSCCPARQEVGASMTRGVGGGRT